MRYCTFCKKDIGSLGLASHRAGHRRRLEKFIGEIRAGHLGKDTIKQLWGNYNLSGVPTGTRGAMADEVQRQLNNIQYL